jgi:hypothetical protein
MRHVAAAEGAAGSFGQSPFALARGQQFERYAFNDDARRLRSELERAFVLPSGSSGLADFRLKRSSGPHATIDAAEAHTTEWLQDLAVGQRTETIAAGATIRIPGGVMLPTATLCVDVLAINQRGEALELAVGEIKVYPDRRGYTDATQLATSRAQAGMYVHGLRLVIGKLGLEKRIRISDRGFLVLSRAGTNFLSLRANEDFAGQARRAQEGLAALSDCAASFDLVGMAPKLALSVIQAAPTTLCEDCLAFCERFDVCRQRAAERGDGATLGDAVHRYLGGTSLDRVKQIFKGDPPKDAHESEILTLLRRAEEMHGG